MLFTSGGGEEVKVGVEAKRMGEEVDVERIEKAM